MSVNYISVSIVNGTTTDSGYLTTICGYDVGMLVRSSIHHRKRETLHDIKGR